MRLTLLCAAAFLLGQGDEEWKAGLAEVRITPEEPLHLSGYASRNKPHERVAQDLHAKALALEDAGGRRALLLTTDLIGFNAPVIDPVCARIAEKCGLKREQILVNSSHTHSGPRLSLSPAPRENIPAADAEKTVAYTRALQDRLVEVAARALERLEPARLAWAAGVATFVMNRREPTPQGIILGVNPRGPADRTVPVLRVSAPDGRLRAVLFGCACHNTTLTGNNYQVCGDYAGFAQAAIQERHAGAQAMFMLGCGGDANPHPRGTMELAREHGGALGREVCRVLDGRMAAVRGPLRAALDRVDLPFQALSREELAKIAAGDRHRSAVAKQALAALDRGEKLPTGYNAPIALWQFGSDLTLVALPGETVVDYALAVERAVGPLSLWVAGYCNDKFGYLASARVTREGGYESQGLSAGFGGPGFFAESAEDVVVRKVRELAEKAGRKLP